ncbi:DUF6168 family protein [Robiginitalea sediminis]|uniref:DUF6168 family protein n=1 Tax=Robiginitalea sediminis TaxID=1982593 RepID=UPI000B4BEA6E|nr:DUF6168 family protein [Robiginitalea sediminis]
MKRPGFFLRYTVALTLGMGLVFAAHALIRKASGAPPLANLLTEAYAANYLLALGIVAILYGVRKRARYQIGFLFIGGSLLKFAIFFLFFFPAYNADGDLSRAEFLSFFIPYFTALVLETYFTSRMLHNLEAEQAP